MSASRHTRRFSLASGLVAVALFVVACGDSATDPSPSPLAGLTSAVAHDSTGSAPPDFPASAGPGHFHGTVLAPSAPGAGGDTLATAPRIAGVVVTAYPVLAGSGADVALGAAAATATTGADGKFTLPTLPGGDYVVTFAPPASGAYGGVWVTATAHPSSHEHPWWVVLWLK